MKKIQLIICLLVSVAAFAQTSIRPLTGKSNPAPWFQPYDFNPALFKQPALSFGPMARWWWPGKHHFRQRIFSSIKEDGMIR